ncbi:nuclear RNA export factor 1-like [Diabrotica undecimpunctata]|uniref:nuclear RNA export factor 1-like n=1 Tax=Diabrotica undecimpunctata TaxID=50387 RepID=UPI003B635C72
MDKKNKMETQELMNQRIEQVEQLNFIRYKIPDPQHVLITDSCIGVLPKHRGLLKDVNYWHKFMVRNIGNAKRDQVLIAILDHVFPFDLIPVLYWVEDDYANFVGRNCGPAIEKLCSGNLVVPNPKSTTPFRLSIMLRFASISDLKIDVQRNLRFVLNRRWTDSRNVLDLTNFHEDEDLIEFTPLFQPKIMYFVLRISKQLNKPVRTLILRNNRIKVLDPLKVLVSPPNSVKCINLSNNLIDDMDSLQHIKDLNLTLLYLEGNPLCSKYGPEEYYFNIMKNLKYLTHLDGLLLRKDGFPISRRHYMCDLGAVDFVNQFIEYYFYLYDLQDRNILKLAYHKDAMFSLTASYITDQVSSRSTRMPKYLSLSRNIQKMANFSQCHNNLIRGNQQIVNVLKNLPQCEHYRPSFGVELMHYTNTSAVVSVSGVFKESAETLLDSEQLFGFRRTFVLTIKSDGGCVIINELMHIHNAFTWQVVDSFKHPRSAVQTIEFPRSESDNQKAINAFKRITTLNTKYARRCLEDRQYNMKMALLLFVDLYKRNQIPADGFTNTGKNSTYAEVGNDQNNQNKKMRV